MMLLATTTVTVTRPVATGDPYEAAATTTPYVGLQAHLSAPSGDDVVVGGDKEIVTATVYLPAGTTIERTDLITDLRTGFTYSVVWVRQRHGLGLEHTQAGLRSVTGGAA